MIPQKVGIVKESALPHLRLKRGKIAVLQEQATAQ